MPLTDPASFEAAVQRMTRAIFDERCPGIRLVEQDEAIYREAALAALRVLGVAPAVPTQGALALRKLRDYAKNVFDRTKLAENAKLVTFACNIYQDADAALAGVDEQIGDIAPLLEIIADVTKLLETRHEVQIDCPGASSCESGCVGHGYDVVNAFALALALRVDPAATQSDTPV